MSAISSRTWLLLSQLALLSSAYATTSPLFGKVSLNGSIVDSACTIDIGSYEQVVDMGVLPLGAIRQYGYGPIRPFSITLIGCTLTSYAGNQWQGFSVTFDGPSKGEWFTLSGEARGVALSLQDIYGQPIYPGQSTPKQAIASGNLKLNYNLRLISNNQTLRPGEYQSAIRFKLNYY